MDGWIDRLDDAIFKVKVSRFFSTQSPSEHTHTYTHKFNLNLEKE